ncbi:hypothetical protein BX600DRAFT_499417 [Xylariales sp. PMI_506]|nr:hypothetical protein BX600DRAFT_499417 [Xylariales sp. PMI_506]
MSTGLVPADQLSAFYDPVRHQLTLAAKGSVQPITKNIHFVRQPFVGGLLFELLGTTYGVMGPKEPYHVSQKESVSIIPFPRDVIVKTAQEPKGKPVPIYWGGLGGKDATDGAEGQVVNPTAPSSTEGSGPSKVLPAFTEHAITALLGLPFSIKQDAIVPKMGSVTLDYDKSILELVSAGISDTQIVWTFVAKTTGDTQASVLVSGGIAEYVINIPYDIRIIVLDESK